MLKDEEMPLQFDEMVFKGIHKKHNKHPDRFVKAQRVPSVEQQEDIVKLLAYNGLWVTLTYGAGLLNKFAPWLGFIFKKAVDLRFKGLWKQKELL